VSYFQAFLSQLQIKVLRYKITMTFYTFITLFCCSIFIYDIFIYSLISVCINLSCINLKSINLKYLNKHKC